MSFEEMKEQLFPKFKEHEDVWEYCLKCKEGLPEFTKIKDIQKWENKYRGNETIWKNYIDYTNILHTQEFFIDNKNELNIAYPGKK